MMIRSTSNTKLAIILIISAIPLLILIPTGTSNKDGADLSACNNLGDRTSKLQCWEKTVDIDIPRVGLTKTLQSIAALYKESIDFRPVCHSLVHKVGEGAYREFLKTDTLEIIPETSICEYGFYHGFTETLAALNGAPDVARHFCETVRNQLEFEYSDIASQCYHGFGHGSVDIHNEKIWGDERAMIKPAVDLCEAVTVDSDTLFRCSTGVFDSIGISYFTKQYKLAMRESDPFWLCREQDKEELIGACYVSLDPALLLMTELDLRKAIKYIEAIREDHYAKLTMGSLALPVFWIENFSGKEKALQMQEFYKDEGVNVCRSIQSRLSMSCIQSLAHALTQHEQSDTQYKTGLEFCRNDILNSLEKEICTATVWESLKIMYPKTRVNEICDNEGNEYDKQFCL